MIELLHLALLSLGLHIHALVSLDFHRFWVFLFSELHYVSISGLLYWIGFIQNSVYLFLILCSYNKFSTRKACAAAPTIQKPPIHR